jgi:replicative DNA helicase
MDVRAFPHAVEAERALLGGLMQEPDRIPEMAELVFPADFYRPDHGALFQLLVEMYNRNEPIDLVTVPERIGREGKQDNFGGIAYVVELPDHVPSTSNLQHYASVVKEKALLRDLIVTSRKVTESAYAEPEDVGGLLDQASRDLFLLGQTRDRRAWQQVSMVVDEEVMRIEKLGEQTSEVTGYTTGFVELDKMLAGLQPTDLLILAARPGMGKTALAINIAQNVALLERKTVGIFSLEMSRGQLVTRMLCCQARVESEKVRRGRLDSDDWERFLEATEEIRSAPVHIDDTPGLSISGVKSRAKRLKAEHGDLALLVIDYLQLMRGDDARAPREQQISAISRGLKGLAKDLQVPIIALSQLNRGVESRQDKRPMVSDLRESGAIEQDADVIMFIYRDDYYDEESEHQGLAEVIIAKQRNGPTGKATLVFQGKYTRFDNYYRD